MWLTGEKPQSEAPKGVLSDLAASRRGPTPGGVTVVDSIDSSLLGVHYTFYPKSEPGSEIEILFAGASPPQESRP